MYSRSSTERWRVPAHTQGAERCSLEAGTANHQLGNNPGNDLPVGGPGCGALCTFPVDLWTDASLFYTGIDLPVCAVA